MAADFNTGVLTTRGLALLAKWQLGTVTPTITRAVIGSGSYSSGESIVNRTALKSQKLSVGISTKYVQSGSTVLLKAIFDNTTVTTGFRVTEIGIYAIDPDIGEILYSMAVTADAANADYLPAYNGTYPSTIVFNYQIEVGNASSVTIQAGTGAYAPADDFNALSNDVDAVKISAAANELAIRQTIVSLLQDERQIAKLVTAASSTETGTVTLTNSKDYPFNDSKTTISITKTRQNLFYDVEATVTAYSGGLPGDIIISDKQLNGFKIEFDGSAKSVTVAYKIKEGMTV